MCGKHSNFKHLYVHPTLLIYLHVHIWSYSKWISDWWFLLCYPSNLIIQYQNDLTVICGLGPLLNTCPINNILVFLSYANLQINPLHAYLWINLLCLENLFYLENSLFSLDLFPSLPFWHYLWPHLQWIPRSSLREQIFHLSEWMCGLPLLQCFIPIYQLLIWYERNFTEFAWSIRMPYTAEVQSLKYDSAASFRDTDYHHRHIPPHIPSINTEDEVCLYVPMHQDMGNRNNSTFHVSKQEVNNDGTQLKSQIAISVLHDAHTISITQNDFIPLLMIETFC